MASWDAIKSQVVIWLRNDEPSLTLPSVGDLDRYEASTGFQLPLDFRDFVLSFGRGRFEPGSWYFAVPGFNDRGPSSDPTYLTEKFREVACFATRTDEDIAEEFDDPQRARRLLLFCKTDSNDYYGWDPEDVTDAGGREYGVYLLGRYDTRVTRLATTFREFVLNCCFLKAIKPDGSGYYQPPEWRLPDGMEEDDFPIKFKVYRKHW